MVCKEELCTWFTNLSPHKRIDYMCGMLHLCIPIELRFLGTYLEFLAKKDFHHLRNVEGKANSKEELSQISDIDKMIRTQMAVYLALLHSSNSPCAHQLFQMLKRYMQNALPVMGRMDTQTMQNILLVLSMAMYHPAFSFVEKIEMFEYYNLAEEEAAKSNIKPSNEIPILPEPLHKPYDLTTPMLHTTEVPHVCTISSQIVAPALQTIYSSVHHPVLNRPVEIENVHLKNVQVKGARPSKTDHAIVEYHIQVTLSNGDKRDIYKTFQEFADFHKKMSAQFPDGLHSLKMQQLKSNTKNHRKETAASLNEYMQKLLDLIENIKENNALRNFFGMDVRTADVSTSSHPPFVSYDNSPVAQYLPNSGNKDSVIEAHTDKQNPFQLNNYLSGLHNGDMCSLSLIDPHHQEMAFSGHSQVCSTKTTSLLLDSPCQSTSSKSPPNICLGSPCPDQCNCSKLTLFIRSHGLAAFQHTLAGYTLEQLSLMNINDIEGIGLPKDVAVTVKSLLDAKKFKDIPLRPLNAVVDPWAQNTIHSAYVKHAFFPPQFHPTVPPAMLDNNQNHQNINPLHIGGRCQSPTNTSDCANPSSKLNIQMSPSVHTIQSHMQSHSTESSSEDDKNAVEPKSNEKCNEHSSVTPCQASPYKSNNDSKFDHTLHNGTPPLTAELSGSSPLGSSSYRSNPTSNSNPAFLPRSLNIPKPFHTNININPNSFITMPENSFLQHDLAVTITTTSNSLGYPMMQYNVDNRPFYYINSPVNRTPFGPLNGSRPYYVNTNPAVHQSNVIHPHQNLVNSVSRAPFYQEAQEVMFHSITGAVTGNNVILNGHDNQQPTQSVSNTDILASRVPVVMNSVTPVTPSVALTYTNSNATSTSYPMCVSCGCSGHRESVPIQNMPVYHQFPNVWQQPPYHNGYLPLPQYLSPHPIPYSNGLNQDVFVSHAQCLAMPNLVPQGVTSPQVVQSPCSLKNNNLPLGGYSKKKTRKMNCHNCGSSNHLATDCQECSMEAMSGPTLYMYRVNTDSD